MAEDNPSPAEIAAEIRAHEQGLPRKSRTAQALRAVVGASSLAYGLRCLQSATDAARAEGREGSENAIARWREQWSAAMRLSRAAGV